MCNPYEPGFMECVGYVSPPRWNPYAPTVGLDASAFTVLPSPPLAEVALPTVLRVDDELHAMRVTLATPGTPVSEPGVMCLLLAGAIWSLCRGRR